MMAIRPRVSKVTSCSDMVTAYTSDQLVYRYVEIKTRKQRRQNNLPGHLTNVKPRSGERIGVGKLEHSEVPRLNLCASIGQ